MKDLLYKIQYEDDEKAFRLFYEQYAFRLWQLAYAFLKSKEQAEEIVNDVFLSVWKKRDRLDSIDNIFAYLCTCIKHAALDSLPAGKQQKSAVLPNSPQVDHIGFVMDPEHLLLNSELNFRLKKAIQSLPPRCRLIFKLVKEDGLKHKEVASLLDLSIRTVETQMTIALQRIGASLLPYLPEQRFLQKEGRVNRLETDE